MFVWAWQNDVRSFRRQVSSHRRYHFSFKVFYLRSVTNSIVKYHPRNRLAYSVTSTSTVFVSNPIGSRPLATQPLAVRLQVDQKVLVVVATVACKGLHKVLPPGGGRSTPARGCGPTKGHCCRCALEMVVGATVTSCRTCEQRTTDAKDLWWRWYGTHNLNFVEEFDNKTFPQALSAASF